jgi:hypothetical protein
MPKDIAAATSRAQSVHRPSDPTHDSGDPTTLAPKSTLRGRFEGFKAALLAGLKKLGRAGDCLRYLRSREGHATPAPAKPLTERHVNQPSPTQWVRALPPALVAARAAQATEQAVRDAQAANQAERDPQAAERAERDAQATRSAADIGLEEFAEIPLDGPSGRA